jgi:hypothetical protein
MYWVWNHSRSKGTGRHVMLAVANRITGDDGTARVSTADVRPDSIARGPETGPLGGNQRSENETPSASQRSENRTPPQNARGPETGPQGSENRTPRGPETGPHNQNHLNHVEEEASTPSAVRQISAEDKVEYGNFWQLFPKSQDPDKTRDAWTAEVLRGADPKQITTAAIAYAHEKASEPWRYVKTSARWLSERRYLDKPAPKSTSPAKTAPEDMTDEELQSALQFG